MTPHSTKFFCAAFVFAFANTPLKAQPPDVAGPIYPLLTLDDLTTRIGGLTTVTIQAKDTPLQDVLADIEKQTGLKVVGGERFIVGQRALAQTQGQSQTNPVTLSLDKQPFWVAIRALSKATGLSLQVMPTLAKSPFNASPNQTRVFYTNSQESFKGVSLSKGPFLLIVNGLQDNISTVVNYDEDAQPETIVPKVNSHNTQLNFSLFPDPKFAEFSGQAQITIDAATDENGKNLKSGSNTTFYNANRGQMVQRITTSLQIPDNAGHRIARLNGTMSMFYPRKTEHWEISDALNGPKETKVITANGVTKSYHFDGLRKVGENYELTLRLTSDTTGLDRDNIRYLQRGIGNASPSVSIFDGKGALLSSAQPASGSFGPLGLMGRELINGLNPGERGSVMRLTFWPQRGPQGQVLPTEGPFKLVIDIPNDFAEVKVPFEFRNLRLP